MNYVLLGCLFAISGFFMKFSDDAYDIGKNKQLACLLGIVCAIASAVATIISADAACIFIGILIGNLLAFKVDGFHHVVTLVIFTFLVFVFGVPSLNILVLIICILSALLDEIGHEEISKKTNNKFINLFFEYRFTMKVIILLLAICGIFNIWIFVCFLLFEIFYIISEFFYNELILTFQ